MICTYVMICVSSRRIEMIYSYKNLPLTTTHSKSGSPSSKEKTHTELTEIEIWQQFGFPLYPICSQTEQRVLYKPTGIKHIPMVLHGTTAVTFRNVPPSWTLCPPARGHDALRQGDIMQPGSKDLHGHYALRQGDMMQLGSKDLQVFMQIVFGCDEMN